MSNSAFTVATLQSSGFSGFSGVSGYSAASPGASGYSGYSGFSASTGGGGGTAVLTAGENISARACVFISPYSGYSQTAGYAYNTNATYIWASANSWVLGFATAAATTGNSVTVQLSGTLSGFTGLTPGKIQYLSTVAGGLTETAPSGNIVIAAMALTSTTIAIGWLNECPYGYDTTVIPRNSSAAIYGWFGGGFNGSVSISTTDRITFSAGVTAASTASNLSATRMAMGAATDKSQYGYFAGGVNGSYGSPPVSTTDRITLASSVTAASTASDLSTTRGAVAGLSSGTTYGYFATGNPSAGWNSYFSTTVDRITFSSGITAANASSMGTASDAMAGISDAGTYGYGYFLGGSTISNGGSNLGFIIVFSTSVISARTACNISAPLMFAAGISDNTLKGYYSGGSTSYSDQVVTTNIVTFSSQVTTAATASNLSVATVNLSGVSDGTNLGYVAGGSTSGGWYTPVCTKNAYKLTFSTGLYAASTVSNLSSAIYSPGSLSDFTV